MTVPQALADLRAYPVAYPNLDLNVVCGCAHLQIRKGAVQEGVQRIDGVAVFTTGMAQRTTLLSKRLADTFAQLPQVDQTLATVKRSAGTLPPAVETAMTTLSQVASQAGAVLQTAAHSVQQAAWDITAQVSEPIRQEQADLQGAISAPETAYYYVSATPRTHTHTHTHTLLLTLSM